MMLKMKIQINIKKIGFNKFDFKKKTNKCLMI